MNFKRLGRFLRYCASAPRTVGVAPACQWIFSTAQLNLKFSTPEVVSVRPRFLKHRVKLRARTSDAFVFRQIMIENEYLPLKDLHAQTILDLGANIGLASAWFLNQFPEACVFAVEADLDNYKACCANLAPYGDRARVIHGAAWSKRTTLVLRRAKCAADNRVEETRAGDTGEIRVEGWDMGSLIEMSGFESVDLLKIDIEGAEAEVFRADSGGWLPLVRNLCIELHGGSCREAFSQALTNYEFQHSQSGELDICKDLRPAYPPYGSSSRAESFFATRPPALQ